MVTTSFGKRFSCSHGFLSCTSFIKQKQGAQPFQTDLSLWFCRWSLSDCRLPGKALTHSVYGQRRSLWHWGGLASSQSAPLNEAERPCLAVELSLSWSESSALNSVSRPDLRFTLLAASSPLVHIDKATRQLHLYTIKNRSLLHEEECRTRSEYSPSKPFARQTVREVMRPVSRSKSSLTQNTDGDGTAKKFRWSCFGPVTNFCLVRACPGAWLTTSCERLARAVFAQNFSNVSSLSIPSLSVPLSTALLAALRSSVTRSSASLHCSDKYVAHTSQKRLQNRLSALYQISFCWWHSSGAPWVPSCLIFSIIFIRLLDNLCRLLLLLYFLND